MAKPKLGAVSLDKVFAALDKGEVDDALAQLLAIWKTARSPVLAEAIDVLSTRVGSGAIEGDSSDALARAWNKVEKAGDTADLELLLAKIRTGTDIDGVVKRIAKLEKRYPGDPRLASFVHTQLDQLAFTASSSSRVWGALFDVLDHVRDPRTVGVVTATRSRWDKKLAKRGKYHRSFLEFLDRAAELAKGVAVIDVPREAIAPILAFGKVVESEDDQQLAALFAEVYRNPDDDHVRSVLADALVEKDDPRGELIHLQLRTELSAAERKCVKELVGKHGRAWLGALCEFTSKKANELVYERGFATRVSLVKPPTSHPAYPVDAPEMATIETLDVSASLSVVMEKRFRLNEGLPEWIRKFPRVRRLELGARARFEQLVEGGPVPYTEILVDDPRREAWFTRKNFPKLERVILPYGRGHIDVSKDWTFTKQG